MVIIGVDPGYAIVGIGAIELKGSKFRTLDYGAITTEAGEKTTSRLRQIYNGMTFYLNKYKPDCVSIEELFFNSNKTTAIKVAQARGVILLAATNAGIPVYEYTPLQVKQSVTGYGRADKTQVQTMIKMLLHLDKIPKPDDAADALALAICHANSSRLNSITGNDEAI